MRALINLIIAACFIACPAFAAEKKSVAKVKKASAVSKAKVNKSKKVAHSASKKKGKFKIKILNYAQLSRLPKAKRLKYMKDIRELLITMEAYQQKYEVASNPYLEKLKEQFAWLMKNAEFMPEASAADEDQRLQAYKAYAQGRIEADRMAKLKRLSNVFPVYNGNEWTCGQGLRFDSWAGTCYLENPAGTTTFSDAGITGGEICPTELGFHDVAHSSTTSSGGSSWIQRQRACVPNGSWDKLTPARQASVDKGERLPANLFNGPYTQAQADAAAGGTGVSTDVTSGTNVDGGETVVDPKTAPENAEEVAAGTEEVPADETPAEEAAAEPAACNPAGLSCKSLTPEAKAAAIARFRSNGKTDDAICVSGGFLARYKGNVKKPGGCDVIKRLPYGDFGKQHPKCDAGRAMCNPVAFCLMAKGKAPNGAEVELPAIFCVDIKGTAEKNAPITETCNNEMARALRGEFYKDKTGKVHDGELVEGLKGFSVTQCDGLSLKGLAIQTEWDAMVKDTQELLNNWCTDKNPDVQALFCTECQILTEKLAKANTDAGATNCDGAALTTPDEPGTPPKVEDGEAISESTDDLG